MTGYELPHPIREFSVETHGGLTWLDIHLQGIRLYFPIPDARRVKDVQLVLRYKDITDAEA